MKRLPRRAPRWSADNDPLIRHLKREISLSEAADTGRADTRHYAKRQFTWFRHQLPEFEWVEPEQGMAWLKSHIFGLARGRKPG